jgi:hypothetical protein
MLHEALVTLGDEEAMLRVAVTAEVLISDEAWSVCEKLGLHEGLDIGEVQVAPWAPKSLGGHVIHTWGLLRCDVRAESELEAADMNLQVEGAIGARAYSMEP